MGAQDEMAVTLPNFPTDNKWSPSWSIKIHIAGDYDMAVKVCREYCDKVGWCVTVTPTIYVYTGGQEDGVTVGIINYPRFPTTTQELERKALELAEKLLNVLDQQSYTIETPSTCKWISYREDS